MVPFDRSSGKFRLKVLDLNGQVTRKQLMRPSHDSGCGAYRLAAGKSRYLLNMVWINTSALDNTFIIQNGGQGRHLTLKVNCLGMETVIVSISLVCAF